MNKIFDPALTIEAFMLGVVAWAFITSRKSLRLSLIPVSESSRQRINSYDEKNIPVHVSMKYSIQDVQHVIRSLRRDFYTTVTSKGLPCPIYNPKQLTNLRQKTQSHLN